MVDIRRLRPSFVIGTPGLEGFVENGWQGRDLIVSGVGVHVLDPTARCVMTTVEQGDLPRQSGILQTLARENRVEYRMGTFAALGANATVTEEGMISVGDDVEFA